MSLILVLTTGGTIDGFVSGKRSEISSESIVPSLLKQARLTNPYRVEQLFMKDSSDITSQDREAILSRCLESREKNIVVTHGTNTMAETAKYLGKQAIPKTIVLTGSAFPAIEENTDAFFNLGSAFSAAQLLPAGVYVCMNGRVFSHENVRKNVEKTVFESEA